MSHPLTVELTDAAYTALQLRADAAAQSPAELAAAALEQCFATPPGEKSATNAQQEAARKRFERHFGAVNLGYATGSDNESIDADLARRLRRLPRG